MGDMSDTFRAMKEHSKEKRESNRQHGLDEIRKTGIPFKLLNGGAHIQIATYDYWPGTGKFIDRKTGHKGRGIKNLLNNLSKTQ